MNKRSINPLIILGLAIPVSALYVARVMLTGQSLVWASIGYVVNGLAFGLLQSLFHVRPRYIIAFLSTALVPLLAYLFLAGLLLLAGLGIFLYGEIPIPYSIEILTIPERLGILVGSIVLAIVLAVLVIPFGLIGVVGRYLGDVLLPRLTKNYLIRSSSEFSTPQVEYLSELNQALSERFKMDEIKSLCFELGVDFEELSGEGKSGKVRELIIYAGNRDLIPELDGLVRRNRPTLNLKPMPDSWEQSEEEVEGSDHELNKFDQANYRLAKYLVVSLSVLLIISSILIAAI